MTSIKSFVTNQLREEGCDRDAKSACDRDERLWLLSDSNGANCDGVEFFVVFPEEGDSLDLECELGAHGTTLFEGRWETEVKVNGKTLAPVGKWETLCLDFDSKYAYFERSVPLEAGRRFSRRVLLSYCESLLVIADELAPRADERGETLLRSIRSLLPATPDVAPNVDDDAREIGFYSTPSALSTDSTRGKKTKRGKTSGKRDEEEALVAELANSAAATTAKPNAKTPAKPIALFYPIGLPEWRADASRGDFRLIDRQGERGRGLELTTSDTASTIFAPLVVDFNRRRAERKRAWKPLTVGESLRQAKKEDAFGRKLQLGNEQYVLYASTTDSPAVRSILGRHLFSDFMFGKFLASLGVDPIIDVELEDEER